MNLGIAGTFTFIVLVLAIVLSVSVGAAYMFRRNRRKKGDLSFSLLLFAFAFTLVHQLLILLDLYATRPELLFLPIYFTLSFGPLLFFAVKLWLYSNYRFEWSDLKHAILPVLQVLYFIGFFVQDTSFKMDWTQERHFYSPFYGSMEMLLYIITFYAYLYASWRYIRFKNASLRHSKNESAKRAVLLLKRLVQILFVLFWINSGYIIADFAVNEFFKFNLHSIKGFTRFGDLSFAGLGLWTAWWGWRSLVKR